MNPTTSFVLVTAAGLFYAAGIVVQIRARTPSAKDALLHLGVSGAGLVLNLIPVLGFMLPSTDWSDGSEAVHGALGAVSLLLILLLVTVGGALFRYKMKSGLYAARDDDAFSRKIKRGLRKGGVVWAVTWLAAYLTGVGLYFGGGA